ncbi:MAG: hypothetical protein M1829_002920 [Trizodia sp. TS-e1964]|nr:MAG: hypothetical protein M1829_002920 [Trizodia sp. TS-e1964]
MGPTEKRRPFESFWAIIRFRDATGETPVVGRLGSIQGPAFNLKLMISLSAVNADLAFRGSQNNGEQGNLERTQSFTANFPRHLVANFHSENMPAGFTNLYIAQFSAGNNRHTPPTSLSAQQRGKITHYLSFEAVSALTLGWHSPPLPETRPSKAIVEELTNFLTINNARFVEGAEG